MANITKRLRLKLQKQPRFVTTPHVWNITKRMKKEEEYAVNKIWDRLDKKLKQVV